MIKRLAERVRPVTFVWHSRYRCMVVVVWVTISIVAVNALVVGALIVKFRKEARRREPESDGDRSTSHARPTVKLA